MVLHSDSPSFGVRLTVAYDGTDFAGFQVQPGCRTVQSELERAIGDMAGHPVRVRTAGRTDAGVHAEGQIVAFDAKRSIPSVGWIRGLNRSLPPDVSVRAAAQCAAGYEPRFDTIDKTYRYLLHVSETRNPAYRNRAWHLLPRMRLRAGGREMRLDVRSMRAAASLLVGKHDFVAFRATDDTRTNTTRTLFRVDVLDHVFGDPEMMAIEVCGTAFMKNMVRILVGTLVEVAQGRREVARVAELLGSAGTRCLAGKTAPAHGLSLVSVTLGRKARQRAAET